MARLLLDAGGRGRLPSGAQLYEAIRGVLDQVAAGQGDNPKA